MLAPISNPALTLEPSLKLIDYIKSLTIKDNTPDNIVAIIKGNSICPNYFNCDFKYSLNEEDYQFLNSLTLPTVPYGDIPQILNITENKSPNVKNCITVNDLRWLNNHLEQERKKGHIVYLHELLENCKVVLPQNEVVPRNPILEKRCEKLRAQQANREYRAMTKNIDNIRKQEPEDTISYQMKQMNRQLIAIGQFIISVLAGFAFGFIGIELIIGNLDFGFRLLLGIICALVIALAELYFLAKKLNEDLNFETKIEEKYRQSKMHLD